MAFLIRLQSKALGRLHRGAWLLVGALGLGACASDTDCLKRNGPAVTQRRAVDRRTRAVLVYDNVDLTIVPDTATYAEVRAGEHVIDGLTLNYRDARTLVLRNTTGCNWARSYDTPHEVRLHAPRLADVRQYGYGLVRTASPWARDTLEVHQVGDGDIQLDVASRYLLTYMWELGDLTLRGTAGEFHAQMGGVGFLYANELTAQTCSFETKRTSLGDAHLRVTQQLRGTVQGRGTLYYRAPAGGVDIKGSGRVVPQ